MNKDAKCWINGQILPAHQAQLSVYDHGVLYGDGVFEGLRFYANKVFMLDAHLQRLQRSAFALSLDLPLKLDEIKLAIEQLISQYSKDTGYLRLVVTRGTGSLGIDPQKCNQPNLFIIADELSVVTTEHVATGVSLLIATTRRTPAQCLNPEIKSLNYLNNILARIEANKAGMDEAIMLNLQGHISEGTVDNFFIIKDNTLYTPRIEDGLLRGITRDVIIELASQLSIPCVETSLTPDDALQADECFLSGTGAELIPVKQINEYCFSAPSTPIYPLIRQAFQQMIRDHCENRN